MTRAVSLSEAHALVLVPVLSLLRSPNPEPGLNQSPNPVPPHLPKPAPVPAPPPDRSPALNPAPSLVLVPVPALSSDFGLFVTSPPPSVSLLPSIYIPRARQHYPHLLFFDKQLQNTRRSCSMSLMHMLLHFICPLPTYVFISGVCNNNNRVQCQFYKFKRRYGICLSLF